MPKQTFYVCVEDPVLGVETWYITRAYGKETAAAAVADRANVQNLDVIGSRLTIEAFTDKPEWM